jgi:hypothetical protein
MIAIILSTCLITDPTVCRNHKIPLSSEPSPTHCMKHAQSHIAQWSDEHPGWRVVRWQCRPTSEQDI